MFVQIKEFLSKVKWLNRKEGTKRVYNKIRTVSATDFQIKDKIKDILS